MSTHRIDPAGSCTLCGRPVDEHNRNVRFRLPDPVLALPDRERTAGTWMSHGDASTSVMMQVPDAGPFIRCILPVHLDGGYTLDFGVWVAVHPDALQHALHVWWEPEYEQLELNGLLANRLPRWDTLGAPVRAVVRTAEHTPYIVETSNDTLALVLQHEWPHEEVLAGLPK